MRISEKTKKIKVLVLDVDGVLTNANVAFNQKGEELRNLNMRDSKGIVLGQASGLTIALMTNEKGKEIVHMAQKAHIKEVHLGAKNKLKEMKTLVKKLRISLKEAAFVGDDINDIPALEVVGLPIAVADAVDEVKKLVVKKKGLTLKKKGGHGAVREAIETILKAKRVWRDTVKENIEWLKKQ